jgi:hypothetical protein
MSDVYVGCETQPCFFFHKSIHITQKHALLTEQLLHTLALTFQRFWLTFFFFFARGQDNSTSSNRLWAGWLEFDSQQCNSFLSTVSGLIAAHPFSTPKGMGAYSMG